MDRESDFDDDDEEAEKDLQKFLSLWLYLTFNV